VPEAPRLPAYNDAMMKLPEPLSEALLHNLLTVLRAHPDGLSEFQLLRALQRQDLAPFAGADLADPLVLFRTHFILFHGLYRLQARLAAAGEALEIHCVRIAIAPMDRGGGEALATPDPLRPFYLDLANLERMDAAGVEKLLDDFWRRFRGKEARRQALAVLELEDPVQPREIRLQYRRLAMRHHPDRGGDTERLQELNAAMAVLSER
jgi:hypothetical protein